MEPRLEACIFVGCPKGTRRYYFYSPQDKKIFVSTNATFLKEKYIEECESKSEVLLKENPSSDVCTKQTQYEFTFFPPSIVGPSVKRMRVPSDSGG